MPIVALGTIALASSSSGRTADPARAHTPNLVTLAGSSRGLYRAARAAGIDLTLIDRIVDGRQAMPSSVAVRLAAQLGKSLAEVNVAAGTIVDDSSDPGRRNPIPPRPDLGELVRGATTGATQSQLPVGFFVAVVPMTPV